MFFFHVAQRFGIKKEFRIKKEEKITIVVDKLLHSLKYKMYKVLEDMTYDNLDERKSLNKGSKVGNGSIKIWSLINIFSTILIFRNMIHFLFHFLKNGEIITIYMILELNFS